VGAAFAIKVPRDSLVAGRIAPVETPAATRVRTSEPTGAVGRQGGEAAQAMRAITYKHLGSVTRGVAASALGTLAMDASLYRGYRHGGGNAAFPAWESSEGLESWQNAPGPALVAKLLLEGVVNREVPPRYARSLNNATHWGFGLVAGAGYGLLLSGRRKPKVWFGLPFGAAVWANGYVVLPLFGVYKPIWKYDLETLRKDLGAHLVFGTATAAMFRLLRTQSS
jgi:hypothetical protein